MHFSSLRDNFKMKIAHRRFDGFWLKFDFLIMLFGIKIDNWIKGSYEAIHPSVHCFLKHEMVMGGYTGLLNNFGSVHNFIYHTLR